MGVAASITGSKETPSVLLAHAFTRLPRHDTGALSGRRRPIGLIVISHLLGSADGTSPSIQQGKGYNRGIVVIICHGDLSRII